MLFHHINWWFFFTLGFAEKIVVSSNQPIGEQNATPLELRFEEQNVTSLEMKIENWCIKQSMWIRVNKDDNL